MQRVCITQPVLLPSRNLPSGCFSTGSRPLKHKLPQGCGASGPGRSQPWERLWWWGASWRKLTSLWTWLKRGNSRVVGAVRWCLEPFLGMRDLLSQLLGVLYEDGPQLMPASDCLSWRGLYHSPTHGPISFQGKSRPSDWPWLSDRPGRFPQLGTTQKVSSALKFSVGSAELLLGLQQSSVFPSPSPLLLVLPQVICLHWFLGEPHLWHLVSGDNS